MPFVLAILLTTAILIYGVSRIRRQSREGYTSFGLIRIDRSRNPKMYRAVLNLRIAMIFLVGVSVVGEVVMRL